MFNNARVEIRNQFEQRKNETDLENIKNYIFDAEDAAKLFFGRR